MDGLSIGQMARAANVSVHTVRYYERIGLMSVPPRVKSGYRAYSEADPRRLILIHQAREVGFCFEDIAELVQLQPEMETIDLRRVIQKRLDSIDRKLVQLHQWRAALCALQVVHSNGGTVDGFLLRHLADEPASYTSHR